jgi:hypothetical protein
MLYFFNFLTALGGEKGETRHIKLIISGFQGLEKEED